MINTRPPPTPLNAYVFFANALNQVNQELLPDYQVVLIGQIQNRVLVKRDDIFEKKEIDPKEPLLISVIRMRSTAGKIWDWCSSFIMQIPPKAALLSIVNVITDRSGERLRDVATIANIIKKKVSTYNDSLAHPEKYTSLENGALIKSAKGLSVTKGKIYIDGIAVKVPATCFHAEDTMTFERLANGILKLGDPGDNKPFYFHPEQKEEGQLKLFRSIDLSY